MLPARPGVYAIHIGDSYYIGGSNNMRRRAFEHLGCLRRGEHHSGALQRAWNARGVAFVRCSVLATCDVDQLFAAEAAALAGHVGQPGCLNFHRDPRSPKGVTRSQETRQKQAVSATGRRHTDATKTLLSQRALGRRLTEARRAQISTATRGQKNPRAKLSNDDARRIQELHAGGMRQVDLASMFGVHQTAISRVVCRKGGWGDL